MNMITIVIIIIGIIGIIIIINIIRRACHGYNKIVTGTLYYIDLIISINSFIIGKVMQKVTNHIDCHVIGKVMLVINQIVCRREGHVESTNYNLSP